MKLERYKHEIIIKYSIFVVVVILYINCMLTNEVCIIGPKLPKNLFCEIYIVYQLLGVLLL